MAMIFISYSRKDRATLDMLIPQIGNIYGTASYWYDVSIQGGDDWWQAIESEIEACQVFLFLLSDTSVNSEYCIGELDKALQHRKQVLQVILPSLTTEYPTCLPEQYQSQLKKEQYVDLRSAYNEAAQAYCDLSKLWGALNGLISRRRLSLNTTERWLLHNQFQILDILEEKHSSYHDSHFKNAMEILSSGYEWYYDDIAQHIYTQILPYQRGLEVVNILDMFRTLRHCYEGLEDKPDIDEMYIQFMGFSGNEETDALAFTRFMMESMEQFADLMPETGLNSHVPALSIYRRMLRAWNMSKSKYHLTREDIMRVAHAWHE